MLVVSFFIGKVIFLMMIVVFILCMVFIVGNMFLWIFYKVVMVLFLEVNGIDLIMW